MSQSVNRLVRQELPNWGQETLRLLRVTQERPLPHCISEPGSLQTHLASTLSLPWDLASATDRALTLQQPSPIPRVLSSSLERPGPPSYPIRLGSEAQGEFKGIPGGGGEEWGMSMYHGQFKVKASGTASRTC